MCLHFLSFNSSDLVHTTESLRQSRLSSAKAEKDSANCDFVLEPYKLENVRLSRENNELYLELMKLREHSDQHIKGTWGFDDVLNAGSLFSLFYKWERLKSCFKYRKMCWRMLESGNKCALHSTICKWCFWFKIGIKNIKWQDGRHFHETSIVPITEKKSKE